MTLYRKRKTNLVPQSLRSIKCTEKSVDTDDSSISLSNISYESLKMKKVVSLNEKRNSFLLKNCLATL